MNQLILRVLISAIASLTFFLSPAAASNQDIKPAMLITPTPDTQILIYPKPESTQTQTGYGQAGDRVTLLEQVGSNDSKTWNHIRFNDLSKSPSEGWIRSDYLSLQISDQSFQAKTPAKAQDKAQNYPSQGQDQGYASHQKSYPGNSTQQQGYQQKSLPDRASNLKQTLLGIKQKIADAF
ncbi:SH3 domain-containing protein [Phormidium sp. CLA17]|uniref:SH3 domain-containing protein n=1 Tax=Leptolyngbya sp. Cla-17 TaxID=2803751 RepID=UPI001491A8AA|nr:SH3 domain-containing protein [Leptolyngbya sp. Cla-17]MBM0743127.1 SH3 domain-containing protein [Leptolyngbya sp. Cla-17]